MAFSLYHLQLNQCVLDSGLRAQELPVGMRQMAAVVLKQHVKEHWTTEAKYFREPAVGDAEKAAVRAALLPGLADSSSLLRTAVGLAISAIAKWHALAFQTHRKLVKVSHLSHYC